MNVNVNLSLPRQACNGNTVQSVHTAAVRYLHNTEENEPASWMPCFNLNSSRGKDTLIKTNRQVLGICNRGTFECKKTSLLPLMIQLKQLTFQDCRERQDINNVSVLHLVLMMVGDTSYVVYFSALSPSTSVFTTRMHFDCGRWRRCLARADSKAGSVSVHSTLHKQASKHLSVTWDIKLWSAACHLTLLSGRSPNLSKDCLDLDFLTVQKFQSKYV